MMTDGLPKGMNLEQMSIWLWGNEVGYGPVMAIGNNGKVTAATFKYDLKNPTTQATIIPLTGGNPQIPAGMKEICRGTVYISSKLQDVCVCR